MVPSLITFDASPLTEPVDARAVNAYEAELKARRSPNTGAKVATAIGIALLGFTLLMVIVPFIGGMIFAAISGGYSAFITVGVPLFFVTLIFAGLAIAGYFFWRSIRARKTARYRLNRFALANNMTFMERAMDPPLPGMIFQLGHGRFASSLVRGTSPRFVEFGNYQFTTGSGKNARTHQWGYVAVKLDVPLPNIVLDALGNNSMFGSNLPALVGKEQKLSLEGNFDQYFTLYCPRGYETDALYLFTPDIMARFMDHAGELDVEIVDDWLFLYTKRQVSTVDPVTWAWLFGAVGALITKFDQWARWRDDRLLTPGTAAAFVPGSHALPFAPPVGLLTPPPGVAPPGRRLRHSTRWVLIIILGVVAAVSLLVPFLPMLLF